jgi:ferric-dicitrate binding protein FerR (iron transport regulator)
MEEKMLTDFLLGRLDREKESEVLNWIEESEENRIEFNTTKNILAFAHLAHEGRTGSDLLRRKARRITGAESGRLIKTVLRYAATVVVTAGVITSLFIYRTASFREQFASTYQSVTAPPGQTTEVLLADGTRVLLNSGTSITYPALFVSGEREINLSGEAFFEVASDRDNPFIVKAGKIKVKATGTSFNVDAYSDGNEINVTLVEGSVTVKCTDDDYITTLSPGENVRADLTNGDYFKSTVDTYFYTSWQQGIITFSNRPLGEIAKDLERWYNVEINFARESTRTIRYSGAILKNKPIDQVLEILKLTSHFNYAIEIDDDKKSIITIK